MVKFREKTTAKLEANAGKKISFHRLRAMSTLGKISLVVLLLLVLMAITATLIAPYDPLKIYTARTAPGAEFLFGTDDKGRDVLSRIMYGARYSLVIGLGSTALALVTGAIIGAVAAVTRTWISEVIMRIIDIIMSFPGIALAATVVVVMSPSIPSLIIAIAILYAPQIARVVRANIMSEYGQDYVRAAIVAGANAPWILTKHVMRNCLAPIMVFTVVCVADAIVFEASLAFISAGIPEPTPTWGNILADARAGVLSGRWWQALFPGLFIMITTLCLNILSEGITDAMRRKNNRVAVRQASAHPVSELLGSTMIAIVLWFGGTLILSSKSIIDAPSFMSYMAILYCIIQPIKDLSRAAYGIPKGLASMERINVILNAENPITQTPFSEHISTFNEAISFEDVSFCYEQGGKQVLKNIDLKIYKGRNIAIVGASGAGKSTLVDLIPRFYDPTSGRITIDGINIKDVCIRDLRGLMGNVNQDPILFNDTIFNNIAFGVENATMEHVIAAAKIANAHDFIMEKENGYNTNIGDRGQLLSGGQRQRISIARAILQNPPILILDEATASLDTESERMVQEALDYLMSSRTTISIAHRLSTVKKAYEIIVMNEGRIVERGTHDELLLKNGYYKKLYEMQVL